MMLRGNGDSNSGNHPLTFAIDSSDVRPLAAGTM